MNAPIEPPQSRFSNPRKPPSQVRTLVDLVQWQAEVRGDSWAFTHLPDRSPIPQQLTFIGLDQRAKSIAEALSQHGCRGDRVLIVQNPGLDYVASLLGTMYAGMIAVPVYPPDLFRLRQTLPRLQAITSEADARIMLSSREILGSEVGPLWQLCKDAAIATDEIPTRTALGWDPPRTTHRDLALLQYTSGSTAKPRGVALTHANLMANAEQGFYAFDVPEAVCVFWLPPYHDLGLVGGMLIPLFGGRQSVLMSPIAFVQEPIRWFRAITEYRGTTTASPNFGYEWCFRKIDIQACDGIDLSTIRLAAVGAEPIRAGTLQRFAEKFAPLGFEPSAFTPGYGMAEATLAVTNKPLGTPPVIRTFNRQNLLTVPPRGTPAEKPPGSGRNKPSQGELVQSTIPLVSSGRPVAGCQIKIVDPRSMLALPDGDVGEIWIRSPGVAQGYWHQPELSATTFNVPLQGENPQEDNGGEGGPSELPESLRNPLQRTDGYLRSGDLGFLLDGELFVSGRLKEQIIIAGRNFFPHDIETSIQTAHEAFKVDGGIAFAVESEAGEELVIVHEVLRPKRQNLADLADLIAQTVLDHFGVVPTAICLVSAASLPKTSSGKLRRLDCRDQFLDDELQVLYRWDLPTTRTVAFSGHRSKTANSPSDREQWSELQAKVARIWCDVLDLETARRDQHFLEVGGHSLTAYQLIARVAEDAGVELSIAELFQHPTLGEFADEVERLSARQTTQDRLEKPSSPTERRLDLPLPLTHAQQGFWWLDQLGRRDAFLHVGLSLMGEGCLETARLEEACRSLPERHPGLRTRFFTGIDGLPLQELANPSPLDIRSYDCSAQSARQQKKTVAGVRNDLMVMPFDLTTPPLLRIAILRLGKNRFQLVIVGHHIVCDGYSLWLIAQDLVHSISGKEVAYTTDDWAESLFRHAAPGRTQSATAAPHARYWAKRLHGVTSDQSLHLPKVDAALPQTSEGRSYEEESRSSETHWLSLDAEIVEGIRNIAKRLRVTPFSVYATLWHTILSSYRQESDIIFGVPLANRTHRSEEQVVGALIGTIPFRMNFLDWRNFSDNQRELFQSLDEKISQTHKHWLEDQRHFALSLEEIFESSSIEREESGLPLIRHLLLYQPELAVDIDNGVISFKDYESDYSSLAAYESALAVEPHRAGVKVGLTFAPQKIAPSIAKAMLGSFEALLELVLQPTHALCEDASGRAVASQISASIPALPEKKRLFALGHGRVLSTSPRHLIELLADHSQASPHTIAIQSRRGSMTYRQLDTQSARIAVALQQLGVGPETVVAVDLSRTPALIALLVGIWKAGGAYLPIDPTHPQRRVDEVIADAQPICWIDDQLETKSAVVAPPAVRHIRFQDLLDLAESATMSAGGLPVPTPDQLAYLIYTSGSTGKPKGVAIEHRSVSNLLRAFSRQPGLYRRERFLASTTISFDISVLELFLPFAVGGTCILAERSLAESPETVLELLSTEAIDVIQGTPSSLRLLHSLGWAPQAGQRIWCGGEALPEDLAVALLQAGADLWNVYGPTETTVWSMTNRVLLSDFPTVSIGHPIDATDIYLLDPEDRIVPIGVIGEVCIGGCGLARGYWRQPELSAEKFQMWSPLPSSTPNDRVRIYRTGDLARWLPTGELEFIGRRDRQVKYLGHRIELGEIEAALNSHPAVTSAAAVLTPENLLGGTRLVAFYTIRPGTNLDQDTLQNHLRSRLPGSMLPSIILPLEMLPTTSAGKIDYQSLPLQQCLRSALAKQETVAEHVEPRDEIELKIADAWREVLRLDKVGVDDNFFHLGGHSLAAAQVFARLRTQFTMEIPLREIYRRPSIADLASWYRDQTLHDEVADSTACIEILSNEEPPPDSGKIESLVTIPDTVHTAIAELPLSVAEERLWVVEQVEPNHPFYNLPLAAKIKGHFNLERFTHALNQCVERHDTLRSTYYWVDRAPKRKISPLLQITPKFVDLSFQKNRATKPDSDGLDSSLHTRMREEARQTFDLQSGPLLRVTIYKLDEEQHIVLLVMHHIISDGWSMAVMLAELAEFYRANETGTLPQLPPIELTYSDYARRQQETRKESSSYQKDLRYWTRALENCTETLDLPTDFERPAVQSFDGSTRQIRIEKNVSERIEKLGYLNQATPFMVFLTAYITLLSRYSRQIDLNIGTAVANRPESTLERLIGFFVGTIVIRARIEGTPTFVELLEQVKCNAIEGFAHSSLPFEELVKIFGKARDRSHSPMFQAAFVMQNAPRDFASAPSLSIDPIHVDNGTAKYDLTLFLWKEKDTFAGYVEYRSNLFLPSTIEQFCECFSTLLEAATEDPTTAITDLPLVSDNRRETTLQRSLGPQVKFAGPALLHELIAHRARQFPNKIAVIYQDHQWSYQEFWQLTGQLARGLQIRKHSDQAPVVVYLPRSDLQVASQIAVNRCGLAFVPLDTNFPVERVAAIASDVGARWIVTDTLGKKKLSESPNGNFQCVTPDELIQDDDDLLEPVSVSDCSPAYLIFTSGSTGTPKGVVIEHRSICNFVHCFCEIVEMTVDDRCSHTLSPSFDGALSESITTLTFGATLIIVDSDQTFDPQKLTRVLHQHGVTFGAFTPALLASLNPQDLPDLRRVLSGGAKLTEAVVKKWGAHGVVFNGYGPTECTIGSSIHKVTTPVGRNPAVGRPMANMSMYILDSNLDFVPDGVPGEVYIGGIGVAREYWNQPTLTHERFIPDPFASRTATTPVPRMYRTGDLGRWNSAGLIEILGRCDEQIKLRGYRIEPGEISAVLDSLPEVHSSTVVAWGDDESSDTKTRLIAYIVPSLEFADTAVTAEKEHVESWRDLFDESQHRSGFVLRPEDNFSGWQSVFTGQSIDPKLMRQWADATAERIDEIKPRNMLEVGCGTGLILLRLKHGFEHYHGVDLLPSAIEQLRYTLQSRTDLAEKVTLEQRTANNLDGIRPDSFDTIVLNSVVQYFPSFTYLLTVLRQAVELAEVGGTIFLGDLRDRRLQAAFALEVEAFRAGNEQIDAFQLRRRVLSRIEHDEELLLDPRMFACLSRLIPRVADVSIRYKIGDDINELNRYRYDAIIQLDRPSEANPNKKADYHESPWVDRYGAFRLPQIHWACLSASSHRFRFDELRRDSLEWVKHSVELEDIERQARDEGYVWKNIDPGFDPDDTSTWTNHPMDRRVQSRLTHRLREQLAKRLPDYMIPSAFIRIENLPKTVQGKIDKAALPPPPAARPPGTNHFSPPSDETERVIAGIWENLLELSPIGIDDDFFSLGGHSMLAVRMVNEIGEITGVQIPLASLFRQPTIRRLADFIRNPKSSPQQDRCVIHLNQTDSGVPLYCVHPAGGTAFCYRELAAHLEAERPVFGIQAKGVDGTTEPHQKMEEMAAYYVTGIIENTPAGPFDLLGWSMGGNIAFEVARQLHDAGREVRNLYLLDAGVISGETEISEDNFLPLISALFPDQSHQSLDELRSRTPEEQAHYFITQAAKAGILPIETDMIGMDIFRVFQANLKAVHSYRVEPFHGRIHLVRPEDQKKTGDLFDDLTLGWKPWVDEITVHWVPGDHAGMLRGKAVMALVNLLD